MKVLILKGDRHHIWVHINRIQRIHTHNFYNYNQIIIHTIDKFKITIHDYHMDAFMPIFNNFIESDKKVKILKMLDLKVDNDCAFMRSNDWITNVVKG